MRWGRGDKAGEGHSHSVIAGTAGVEYSNEESMIWGMALLKPRSDLLGKKCSLRKKQCSRTPRTLKSQATFSFVCVLKAEEGEVKVQLQVPSLVSPPYLKYMVYACMCLCILTCVCHTVCKCTYTCICMPMEAQSLHECLL